MSQRQIGRRKYLMLTSAGVTGAVAGCSQGNVTDDNAGTNDIVIWVRTGEEITATLTVENTSNGEMLFEQTETYEELTYPEDGPNERYKNVFGTESIRIIMEVTDGPERTREYSGRKHANINITYDGSLAFNSSQ